MAGHDCAAIATAPAAFAVSSRPDDRSGVGTLRLDEAFNRFFSDVEKRALRIAEISVRDRDDALDLVQDAMIRLVKRYGHRPSEEWAPLFYRILQNGVRDWHRRRFVRRRIFAWFGPADADAGTDVVGQAADPAGRTPEEELESREAMVQLQTALTGLPPRQREAFMLRTFEGLDVAGTALAMGCSEGSVKTHYFRAIQALKDSLGEHR